MALTNSDHTHMTLILEFTVYALKNPIAMISRQVSL